MKSLILLPEMLQDETCFLVLGSVVKADLLLVMGECCPILVFSIRYLVYTAGELRYRQQRRACFDFGFWKIVFS